MCRFTLGNDFKQMLKLHKADQFLSNWLLIFRGQSFKLGDYCTVNIIEYIIMSHLLLVFRKAYTYPDTIRGIKFDSF